MRFFNKLYIVFSNSNKTCVAKQKVHAFKQQKYAKKYLLDFQQIAFKLKWSQAAFIA
jgi:hypothetical protein